MDVGGNSSGVAGRLSNFTARRFMFDEVECHSMEGLLQSFKFSKTHIQLEVCKLIGFGAKRRGSKKDWQTNQKLFWRGEAIPRKSKEYQYLLNSAFNALYQNEHFRSDLLSTGKAVFTHSIGKHSESLTVLTEREFCSRLMLLREHGTCGQEFEFKPILDSDDIQEEMDLL